MTKIPQPDAHLLPMEQWTAIIGPYSEEGPTVERLHKLISDKDHHQI